MRLTPTLLSTLLSTRLPTLLSGMTLALLLPCCAIAASPPATRAPAATMPSWEQLTPAQQALLLAPVRERWDESPDERTRMYEHAQRWQSMTPDQRASAHRGMRRWHHMDPQQRQQARALFGKMRTMQPEQRNALREQWKTMTPGQRRDWVDKNSPQNGEK